MKVSQEIRENYVEKLVEAPKVRFFRYNGVIITTLLWTF